MSSPTKTADLVENVLSAMRDSSATGDPTAVGRLGSTPPPAPAAPKVKTSTVTDKVIMRPNGEAYHVRKVGTLGHDDVGVLREARAAGVYLLNYGPPGTGKTAMIEAAYAPIKADGTSDGLYTVQGSGDTEVSDFVGGYIPMPNGSFVWEDGPLLKAMEEGKPLYIDEIALIDPKVLAIVYGVMDGRRELRVTSNPERGVVIAQEGFYVCAAQNPNAPGARMSEALLSRFTMQLLVTTDFTLARKLGVNNKAVTAALNLDKKLQADEVSWAPQLRELLAFKKLEDLFGTQFALNNMVSTAPEIDRKVVADVLSRSFATSVSELKLA